MFLAEARRLGEKLADHNFRVVYGGAQTGAMGDLAEGAMARGGSVLGIYPQLELGHEKSHPKLTEMITVKTMAERKAKMFEVSDAFLVFPGGMGTLDEVFELLVLRFLHESNPNPQLMMYTKPVIFVNVLNFWDPILEALEIMVHQNFITQPLDQMFKVEQDFEQVVHLLQEI
jgi:uncharacterized protein (TIGR00730 family)